MDTIVYPVSDVMRWHLTSLQVTHLAPFTLLPEVSRAEVAVTSGAWDIRRAPCTGILFVILSIFARPPSFCDSGKWWWCRARCNVLWSRSQSRIRIGFGARNGSI